MTETIFDHPAHRNAEELAVKACRLMREAKNLYIEAGNEELSVARDISGLSFADSKLRSIFVISALSCLLKAQEWDEAIKIADEFLASPNLLTPGGLLEIEELRQKSIKRII